MARSYSQSCAKVENSIALNAKCTETILMTGLKTDLAYFKSVENAFGIAEVAAGVKHANGIFEDGLDTEDFLNSLSAEAGIEVIIFPPFLVWHLDWSIIYYPFDIINFYRLLKLELKIWFSTKK